MRRASRLALSALVPLLLWSLPDGSHAQARPRLELGASGKYVVGAGSGLLGTFGAPGGYCTLFVGPGWMLDVEAAIPIPSTGGPRLLQQAGFLVSPGRPSSFYLAVGACEQFNDHGGAHLMLGGGPGFRIGGETSPLAARFELMIRGYVGRHDPYTELEVGARLGGVILRR
jgi:hypothetical protein